MLSPSIPLIPEILHLICEAAEPSKRSLASLARTCSAFEKPALDVLWYSLDQFSHLVKCLPSDLWEIKSTREVKQIIALQQPIFVEDCFRLQEYAKRVNEFRFDSIMQRIRVDQAIYQSLLFLLPGPIFPNLRLLQYDGSGDQLSYLPMLLGPRLKHIQMDCVSGIQQMALIPRLSTAYPSLEGFGIEWISMHSEECFINAVSNAVLRWQNLVTLQVSNIAYSALQELSRYPNLKTLKIARWKSDSTAAKNLGRRGFRSLNHLEIGTETGSDCMEVLQMMDSSPVNQAVFSFSRGQTSALWRTFTSGICDSFCHNNLRSLVVNDEIDLDEDDVAILGEMVEYDAIKPLLVFRRLRELHMQFPLGLYLSDSIQTEEMARSWTNIVQLEFSISSSWRRCPRESTITFEDLLPFAEHCESLSALSLFLDGKSVPEITEQKPGDGIWQTALTKLGVNDSVASQKDHKSIAVFLSSVFPSLRRIESNGDYIDVEDMDPLRKEIYQAWLKANGLIHLLSVVRNQEMLYYTSED